jgi:uncharacterized membrane protein
MAAVDAAMPREKPHITAKIAGRSLYPVLRPYAVGYFFATLGCDLLYFSSQSREDRPFTAVEFGLIAEWLLAAGLLVAAFAGIAALIDFHGERRFRELADLGLYTGGNVLVVVLGLYNLCIRLTDGSDDLMERGLLLSSSTVVVLFCIPSQGWNRLYR